jgi:ElaB/YqjD/DUF883 family membrane-anchored ribosome-binding protein
MSLAETKPQSDAASRSGAGAKILHLKDALVARTGAVGGWTKERAGAARTTAERHPFATAGLAAGAALIGGVALGLLLSGQMAGLKKSLKPSGSIGSRTRSFFRR